jgi:hypothetical protein
VDNTRFGVSYSRIKLGTQRRDRDRTTAVVVVARKTRRDKGYLEKAVVVILKRMKEKG